MIYPSMNGCYDGAPDFKSFADECTEIEKYIVDNYNGQVNAVIGVSQGATLMAILASRNVVTIKKVMPVPYPHGTCPNCRQWVAVF